MLLCYASYNNIWVVAIQFILVCFRQINLDKVKLICMKLTFFLYLYLCSFSMV